MRIREKKIISEKIRVLTVDDNVANIQLIYKGLKDDYDVDMAENGDIALDKLTESDFDIVLLDVNMPKLDGYEVCSLLRNSNRNEKVPVIFISALTSLDDKLKGYVAGGQDYIEKPVMFAELIKKIELAVAQSKQVASLNEQVKFATQTAMTAMSNNSELGIILNFMEQSFQTDNIHDLLKALTECVAMYDVDCCTQVRTGSQHINACSTVPETSRLEGYLLEKAKDADRIVTLGKRGIFNSTRVSMLIRNMPIDDEDKYGRLLDHLAVIVVAADARCKHIELQEQRLGTRNKALDKVVDIADEEIGKLQSQFLHFREEASRIMMELNADVEESLAVFKMTNDQEDRLYRILGQSEREMADLSDWGVAVEESLGRIKSTVISAIENMD